MANRRVGGILFFKVDGEQFQAKGEWTTDLGAPQREGVVGADGPHGFSENPKIPFFEGAITDNDELDLDALYRLRDVTATLELANGKVHVLREAYYAGPGTMTTGQGEVAVRLEGISASEVPA